MHVEFSSKSAGSRPFRILLDNATLVTLISSIASNCTQSLGNSSEIIPSTYSDANYTLKPEQAVQYYRASSVVLTLDGYNDTSALEPEGTPDVPLPPLADMALLTCLNETIGQAVPLVSGSHSELLHPSIMLYVKVASVFLSGF